MGELMDIERAPASMYIYVKGVKEAIDALGVRRDGLLVPMQIEGETLVHLGMLLGEKREAPLKGLKVEEWTPEFQAALDRRGVSNE